MIEDDTRRIIKRQRTIPRIETRETKGCPRHNDLHSNAEPDLEQRSRSQMDLSLHYTSSKTSREEENTPVAKTISRDRERRDCATRGKNDGRKSVE